MTATNGTTDTPTMDAPDAVGVDGEIGRDEQRAIVANHLREWKQTRYSMEISHRVQRKLGTGPEGLAPLLKRLEECEQAIDELQVIQAELA